MREDLGCLSWVLKDDHEVTRWAKQGTLREVEAYTRGSSLFGELQVLWLWLEHGVCREEGQELRQKREVGARSWRTTESKGLTFLTGWKNSLHHHLLQVSDSTFNMVSFWTSPLKQWRRAPMEMKAIRRGILRAGMAQRQWKWVRTPKHDNTGDDNESNHTALWLTLFFNNRIIFEYNVIYEKKHIERKYKLYVGIHLKA